MSLPQFVKPHADNRLDRSEIQRFEHTYQFKLPEAMIEFYLTCNGGYLNPCGNAELDLPLRIVYPITHTFDEHVSTIEQLLEWQKTDGLIPMCYVPFCSDAAGDDYYLRVDDVGYGKIYYLFSEFLDDFLCDPEKYVVADSFELFSSMLQAEK